MLKALLDMPSIKPPLFFLLLLYSFPNAFAQAPMTGNYEYRSKNAKVTYDKTCGYCHPGGQSGGRDYILKNSDNGIISNGDNVMSLDPQTLFSLISNGSWKTSGGPFNVASSMEKGPGWGTAPSYWGKSEMDIAAVRLAPGTL